MSLRFEARIAGPSDYERIVRLCSRAVGPGDYVIQRLKHVIGQRRLFLAFSGEELVGMSNFTRLIDDAGWFGMARTDPKWRRKGVAIFLQQAKAAYARKLGIKKLRLFVLSTNTPSLRACLKGGFKPVSEAAHLTLTLKSRSNSGGNHALKISRRELIEPLLKSKYLGKMKGYAGYRWNFVKMDLRVLEKISRQGEIYSLENAEFILNRPDEFESGEHREFTLLSGSFEKGLNSVISVASQLGSDSIGTFIPYEPYLIYLTRELGFRDDSWGWHCICLEKKI